MHLKRNECGREYTNSLEQLIENGRADFSLGSIELLESRVEALTFFMAMLVEKLHDKGLLEENDITSMMKEYCYSYDEFEIVKDDEEI